MNALLRTSLVLVAVAAPAMSGCASRTAPFDQLDQAQVTILRLQGMEQPAPAPMMGAQPGLFPGFPIPGMTAEQQQQILQQLGQQVQQVIPGLIPPGLIPGMPGAMTPAAPAAQPRFNGFVILGQQPLLDEDMKDEILDLFGSESSFSANRGPCFHPGLGIVMQDPSMPNIELMVSFSCNQVMGNGFRWPYDVNGLTMESSQSLRAIHERLFGPIPPQGA